jgi:hypothetical protein
MEQEKSMFTRRRVIQGLGIGAAGVAVTAVGLPSKALSLLDPPSDRVVRRTPPGYEAWLWDDPRSWENGRVPGENDVAVVQRPIVLDREVLVKGVRIERDGALVFAPQASAALLSRGNVVVRGQLVMQPAAASVRHTLRFVDVDESKFVGGGMEIVDSDVGLWVTDEGLVETAGAAKRPWTRATTGLPAGTRTITVQDATGWLPGDAIAIAPTTRPTPDNDKFHLDVDHCLTYDETVVESVSGNTIRLRDSLRHEHPVVQFADWTGTVRTYGAEVMNLSRNVVIEGTPTGRAHVMFLHAVNPQQLSHVEIRHMGPRQLTPQNREELRDGEDDAETDADGKEFGLLGRYGLHFHHCGDGSRGTIVEGVVAHAIGSHAFVPHESHGITLRECVAHDTQNSAFWYDLNDRAVRDHPATHDSLWERCLASKVVAPPGHPEGYRLTGFMLAEGNDHSNKCVDCVAVGVYTDGRQITNSAVSSGFQWPSRGRAIWAFSGCLAHNIGGSGILAWQNDENVHLLEKFTAYHCGKSGIDHGAYANFWHYRDCVAYANRRGGVALHAVTRRTKSTPDGAPPMLFENIVIDGAGLTRWGFHAEGHRLAAPDIDPATIIRAKVTGCRDACYYEPKLNNHSYVRIVDSSFAGNAFWLHEDASPATKVEVINLNGSGARFLLRQREQGGELVRDWNARRSALG